MNGSIHHRTTGDCVALTFDDGPSDWTLAALGELARANARATFFVTSGGDGDLVRRIAADGHEIGYHCRRHVRHSERERDAVRDEAAADLEWLETLGARPRAWRPPWGDLAPWSAEVAAELGMDLWLWSDDTHDWDGRAAWKMLEDLQMTLRGGSVVLMHDGIGPGAKRSDADETVALIAPLVALCRSRRLEPARLSIGELIDV